jgi:peptidyl-prolyl cis-trans isomerase D
MLEQMRKASQSLVITVLFGIVIAVFIINFGPQSRGSSCEQAMGRNEHHAAEVGTESITTNDFRYGFMLAGGAQIPAKYAKQERLKEMVMDRLIDRELLAAEADRLGFVVTDEEVEDQIADARIIGLGAVHNVPRLQKDGKFNYDAFKSFVQLELGVTPANFIQEQKKEMQAARVRDLLREGVTVSDDEVKTEFLRKNRQINLEYMRFAGRRYEPEVAVTDAEIADYAAKNEAALRKAYDEKKFVYEKVPAQRRVREILIKVPKDAKPEADKAAKAKADALAEKLRKGAKAAGQAGGKPNGKEGATFADVARASSDDAATKVHGGDLGWRAKGATGLGAAVEDKVWDAKPGTVVGPLRGDNGYVIVTVEGAREGEVSFDAAKLELAEEKLREERGNARAKTAAEESAAKAKQAPTATLKTTFPPPSDADEAADKPGAPPRVEETGLFAARGSREGLLVEGIGVSTPLAKAAFALTPEAPVAGPFDVNGNYIVVRLKERKDPDMGELDKKKLELVREAQLAKGERVVGDWTHARCLEAKQDNKITVYPDALRYEDSTEPPAYEPCSGHRGFGG